MDDSITLKSKLSIDKQHKLWLHQSTQVPNITGGKNNLLTNIFLLLEQISCGEIKNLDVVPSFLSEVSKNSWKDYSYSLDIMGLVSNESGSLLLTKIGEDFLLNKDISILAEQLAGRVRLFSEILGLLVQTDLTVEEINKILNNYYPINWKSLGNTRSRTTWLEVLGLIEWLDERKLTATDKGKKFFGTCSVVTPEAVNSLNESVINEIPQAPIEIANLIKELSDLNRREDPRNTYNIWAPSPANYPNKVKNIKSIVENAKKTIEKEDLFSFITERFTLRRSSVESMLPFLKASGLLHEVRRGIFSATPLSMEWINSNSDINFIRILHCKMRFVGEILQNAKKIISRNELYKIGEKYGLNKEKVRWRISFLIDVGLLVEASYSTLQTTTTGESLLKDLPLFEPTTTIMNQEIKKTTQDPDKKDNAYSYIDSILENSINPNAHGLNSGAAFEKSIEEIFSFFGFNSRRISGSGDTDVLLQWTTDDGILHSAILDAKSSSSGTISHTNVSDTAIGNHKDKHKAEFVAIIAPDFSGDTIKSTAEKRGWALLRASELVEIMKSTVDLGLKPKELSLMFKIPNGMRELAEIISNRQRELDLIGLIIARLSIESKSNEFFSARDISLVERNSELSPTTNEVLDVLKFLTNLDLDIVREVNRDKDEKHSTFEIGEVSSAIRYLRAVASSLEDNI
ncbi:MAG: hypothetical protein LBV67_12240 [Streptococcaceae bacterium]|nr:hypothetical protein [Streptococcaceae bacterium]